VSLRSALTANLPLKLTSLILALLLWLLASSEEVASSLLQVDVAVRPPAGRTMIRPLAPVHALVVGPRRELLKLSTAPVRLVHVLPDTLEADEVELPLTAGEVEIPRGVAVRVQDVQPRVLQVALDSTVQRMVPVAPVVHLRGDSGFVLADVSVVPGMVRLLGPRDRVRRVDSVRTEPLELIGSEAPMERFVPLDTAGMGPIRFHPVRVSARVEVEAITERTLSGIPVRLTSAAGAALRPSPDTVSVRVRGREARLGALTEESIVVVADWSGPARPARVALRVLAPAGITAQAEPDSVSLQLRDRDG
jgi:hypothetical protein